MRSRDRCPDCARGRMLTYKTRSTGSLRVRYLKCSACGRTGQEVLQVDFLGREICTRPGKQAATKPWAEPYN